MPSSRAGKLAVPQCLLRYEDLHSGRIPVNRMGISCGWADGPGFSMRSGRWACRLTIWLASSVVIVGGLVFEARLRLLADIKDPVGPADTCVLLDVGPRCRRATDDLQAAIGHVGTSKFTILGLLLGTDGSPAMTQLRLRSSRTRASGSGLKA